MTQPISHSFTPRRLLVLGPARSTHTIDIALAMRERGYEVHLAGFGSSSLPPAGIKGSGIGFSMLAPRSRSPIGMLVRVRDLKRLVNRVRPDVVHAHVLSSDPFIAAIAAIRPLVATAWGSDVLLASRAASWRNRLVTRRADALTADSASLARRLVALGAPEDRVHVINWGVDLARFAPSSSPRAELRRRLDLPEGKLVLSARAHAPIYNTDVILAAFALLAERDPTVNLLLNHDGAQSLPGHAQRYADRIHRYDRVPLERLIDYYRAADVSISIPSSDSSPRTVWEAVACGCPTVVSDLAWVGGMLRPDIEALVVPIDKTAVADALGRILDDPTFASALSEQGRRLVETHHDKTVEMDRLAALYERVCAGSRN